MDIKTLKNNLEKFLNEHLERPLSVFVCFDGKGWAFDYIFPCDENILVSKKETWDKAMNSALNTEGDYCFTYSLYGSEKVDVSVDEIIEEANYIQNIHNKKF